MPKRVLGNAGGADSQQTSTFGDQPYHDPQPGAQTDAGAPSLNGAEHDHEILDLEDDAQPDEATERTALLSSSAPRVRPKVAPAFENLGGSRRVQDPPSFSAAPGGEQEVIRPGGRRPLRLKIDFAFACILLYINLVFLVLAIAAIQSPFLQHNALPAHRGSEFVPIWCALLGMVINFLALLSFVYPEEAPVFSVVTNLATAFFALVILILSVAVTQVRRHEGIFTFVMLSLVIVSALHAAFSARLANKYAPVLLPIPTDEEVLAREEPSYSFGASLKRVAKGSWDFLHISLPLAILHIAIVLVFLLLTISMIIRVVDSSIEQPGQRWKVSPWVWSRKHFPETGGGLWETGGREYSLHLSCRGVGIDDPVPPSLALANGKTSLTTPVKMMERKTVRRTILIESDQGVSGATDAQWVLKMLKQGELTSGDFETRVCWYDRPGYGYSDNSPSSSTPQVVTALTQALTLAGEFARLESTPDFAPSSSNSSFAPTPLARSGFILVSRTYGSLFTSLFSTIHPRTTHSFLYLSPLPPTLHFHSVPHWFLHSVPSFFTRTLPALTSELGIRAIISVCKGNSRKSRVQSGERDKIRGEMQRSWLQEEGERERGEDSISWRAWNVKRGRYPERPTIVLDEAGGKHARGKRYTAEQWDAGQDAFVNDVVRGGLVRREKDWFGACEGEGEEMCRVALKELLVMD